MQRLEFEWVENACPADKPAKDSQCTPYITKHAGSAVTAAHPSGDLCFAALFPHLDLSEKQISLEVKNSRLQFRKTGKTKQSKKPNTAEL